jgi:hypothetical protein
MSVSMMSQSSVGNTVRRLRSKSLRWLAAFVLGVAVASAGTPAHAQGMEAEYQDLVQKGLHEYDLGNFSEAKAFFTRAHALSPNARTLRGLGMSAYELRNYVEAIDYFQRALTASERPLTPQMRTEVSQLLSQARSFVTKLALAVQPAQARVRLDAREVVRDTEGNLLLDPGTHELVVEAPDYETITRNIRTDGGESLSLNLNLRSTREPPPADAQPVQLEPTAVPAPGDAAVDLPAPRSAPAPAADGSLAPWVVVGASGAVAVAGGVLLAVALSNKHAVENPSGNGADGPRYADYQGKADSVLPLSAAGIGALSLGLAGVAAGLIWKLSGEHADERPSARLHVSPGALSVDGRF